MTLEQRVEVLEKDILRVRNTIDEMNCAIATLSTCVSRSMTVDDEAAREQAAKSYEEIFGEKLDLIISLLPPLKV